MKVLRTATLLVVCLGLVLPSAHALALCIDGDGSLALEFAVDGACTGAKMRSDSAERAQADEAGLMVVAVEGCGGCTDVVIRGSGVAVPPPDASDRSRPARAADEATWTMGALVDIRPGGSNIAGSSSTTPAPERPDVMGSSVLQL